MVAPVENAEVEFDDMLTTWMECYHADLGDAIEHVATLAARWDTDKKAWVFFIEREIHNLTKEEEKKFHKECVVAKKRSIRLAQTSSMFQNSNLLSRSRHSRVPEGSQGPVLHSSFSISQVAVPTKPGLQVH